MKKFNSFEKDIRKMSNEAQSLPPAFVWENVAKEIKPKKTNKLFLVFMVFGLFGICTFSVLSYYDNEAKLFNRNTQTNSAYPSLMTDEASKIIIENEEEIEYKKELDNSSIKQNILTATPAIKKQSILTIQDITDSKKANYNIKSKPISSATYFNNTFNQASIKAENTKLKTLTKEIIKPKTIEIIAPNFTLRKLDASDFTLLELEETFNKRVACPMFKKRIKINFFLEANTVLGRNQKSFYDDENFDLTSLRSDSESSWYGYGFNGLAGVNLSKNFYLGLGIDWYQSKELFNHEEEGMSQLIITFDPQTNEPIDTTLTFGKFVHEGEITYTSLDIPVVLGFSKQIRSLSLGLELGASLNQSFEVKGKMFNETAQISRVENEVNVYKEKVGLGLHGAIVCSKKLNNGLSIHIKPKFKTYLNEINHDDYTIETKINYYNIELGLRKNF